MGFAFVMFLFTVGAVVIDVAVYQMMQPEGWGLVYFLALAIMLVVFCATLTWWSLEDAGW